MGFRSKGFGVLKSCKSEILDLMFGALPDNIKMLANGYNLLKGKCK